MKSPQATFANTKLFKCDMMKKFYGWLDAKDPNPHSSYRLKEDDMRHELSD